MKIIHIDIPRSLTTTIKPFDFDTAAYFNNLDIAYDSVDINIEFWQFLLDKVENGLNIEEDIFYPKICPSSIRELNYAIEKINTSLHIPFSPFGFSFDEHLVYSIAGVQKLCETFYGFEAINEFIQLRLSSILQTDEIPAVISLGIDSNQALGFAAIFATALKRLLPTQVKIGIGKHSYENFSLSFWFDQLDKSQALSSIFDFIIYQEEYFGQSLVKLCGVTDEQVQCALTHANNCKEDNISNRTTVYKTLIQQSHYQVFWNIKPEKLVYLMPLSRNKCYWKRCTFCVQINKHIADRFYSESSEIKIALATIQAIYDLGIRHIIFNDEAATPKNVAELCQFLEDKNIHDLQWTVRIIADANFGDSLIAQMAKLGCREVLFGLETVLPDTAQQMGKVSASASEEEVMLLLSRFGHRGIGIFLNLIYAFPTESDADFLTSFQFYQKAKVHIPGITVQFNKFALFYKSKIFQFPEQYGVTVINEQPNFDLQLVFNYVDKFGRRYSDPPNQQYLLESLEMDESELDEVDQNFLETLFQINYASFGFIHKCQTNQNLMRHVLPDC
ncbi:radical SAM protein [Nostoc sp. FACHB-973]|nr:radical SAM protein [Nostoc sp. FACHB-973]